MTIGTWWAGRRSAKMTSAVTTAAWPATTRRRSALTVGMILLLAGICWFGKPPAIDASVDVIDYPVRAKGSDPFWRLQRKTLWGFMDRTGRIVIEPRFAYVRDFMSGLALACVPSPSSSELPCGYIDHAGDFVIPPRFKPVGWVDTPAFTDGVAAIGTDDGAVIIDRNGKILTASPFFWIHRFSEGLASVRIAKPGVVGTPGSVGPELQLFGFIDTTGRIVVEPIYRSSLHFQDGLAGMSIQQGGWGFVDARGRVVIDFTFAEVTSFSDGVATVKDRASKKWGVIDKLGRPLRPFNLIWASPFANGFAIARSENGIGLLGPDGALRFELPYLGLERPSEGLVPFETYDRLKGYIDLTGNVRIPARYRHTTQFSEGLAAVSEASNMDDWVYIDPTGATAIPMRFAYASPFIDGLALVRLKDAWHYIDRQGRIVARDVWEGQRARSVTVRPGRLVGFGLR